jgi:hypothetical protein
MLTLVKLEVPEFANLHEILKGHAEPQLAAYSAS